MSKRGASRICPSSIWNAIGYFGVLWLHNAISGAYNAQRLLACKDSRNATLASLLFSVLYYAVIAWPWIIVALCSLIIFPDLGPGATHDSAYPRMVVTLLPVGLRGMMVMAHPMHVHNVQFQVIERQVLPQLRDTWEEVRAGYVDEGWKDTVLVMPGERVKLLLKFEEYEGLYLYHCHNLEHEDQGMMRNFLVKA